MKIIRQAAHHQSVSYHRSFHYQDEPGYGYGFDCDEQGSVDQMALAPAGKKSYARCLSGTHDGRVLVDDGVACREHTWRKPAVGRCSCGREVDLGGFTNTCGCGSDYNGSGQLLAPREQWGEETGESIGDIMMIG